MMMNIIDVRSSCSGKLFISTLRKVINWKLKTDFSENTKIRKLNFHFQFPNMHFQYTKYKSLYICLRLARLNWVISLWFWYQQSCQRYLWRWCQPKNPMIELVDISQFLKYRSILMQSKLSYLILKTAIPSTPSGYELKITRSGR